MLCLVSNHDFFSKGGYHTCPVIREVFGKGVSHLTFFYLSPRTLGNNDSVCFIFDFSKKNSFWLSNFIKYLSSLLLIRSTNNVPIKFSLFDFFLYIEHFLWNLQTHFSQSAPVFRSFFLSLPIFCNRKLMIGVYWTYRKILEISIWHSQSVCQ